MPPVSKPPYQILLCFSKPAMDHNKMAICRYTTATPNALECYCASSRTSSSCFALASKCDFFLLVGFHAFSIIRNPKLVLVNGCFCTRSCVAMQFEFQFLDLHLVQIGFDALGLIVCPLIGGLRLVHDRTGGVGSLFVK